MDRLKTLDAEFLHIEDGISHMHIAGGCVFGDPPPTEDELIGLIAGKLHQIPRYRQRVRTVPFELGRPVWADDPHFDIHYHVRRTALPAPGGAAEFDALMGRLMSQPLDRNRPLWESWLVEGLEDDRWALVFKVHHCMVDGIAGVRLLEVLLDISPVTPVPEPEPWSPAPEPRGAELVLNAWSGLTADTIATARQLTDAVVHPRRALSAASSTARGLARYAQNLVGGPPLSIEGTIGPHRSWAHADASLADVKTVGHALGGTVNDVVLAVVTGGFRRLLEARDEDPTTAVIRTLVPVSTRSTDAQGVPDNRVSAILYDLPVGIADPIERLAAVEAGMAESKGSHMAEAGAAATSIGDLAPPMIVGNITRAASRMMRKIPQRTVGTVVTNVPGPQLPLYCLGREMLEYRPFVPIAHGVRVGVAILSYNGRLFFGVTGDATTAPDVGVLADGIVAEVEELRAHAANDRGAKAVARPTAPCGRSNEAEVARKASGPPRS